MKNKKVLSILTLVAVGGILTSCTKEQSEVLRPVRLSELKAQLNEGVAANSSKVYLDENGQLIKINDPEDPKANVLKELNMSKSVASMYYSNAKGDLAFNETLQLNVEGKPLKAPIGSLTWASSDASIASVDQNGLVTAVGEGTAIVSATSEAGFKAECRVVVNNTNVFASVAAKSAAKILAAQKSTDWQPVTEVRLLERIKSVTTKGDEISSQFAWDQTLIPSNQHAYFKIISDDKDVKTSNGSIVPSYTEYTFYTTDDYISYIFCNSNGKANYLSLDQAYLVDQGKTPFEGLGEVLQSYFVSGSSIMTRHFSDVLAQKQLDGGYNGCDYIGSFGEDSGQFAFSLIQTGSWKADADDEDEMGVPIGTQLNATINVRYLWENNLLSYENLVQRYDYVVEGVPCSVVETVDFFYQARNVELEWPDVANYSLVDSIFDL